MLFIPTRYFPDVPRSIGFGLVCCLGLHLFDQAICRKKRVVPLESKRVSEPNPNCRVNFMGQLRLTSRVHRSFLSILFFNFPPPRPKWARPCNYSSVHLVWPSLLCGTLQQFSLAYSPSGPSSYSGPPRYIQYLVYNVYIC